MCAATVSYAMVCHDFVALLDVRFQLLEALVGLPTEEADLTGLRKRTGLNVRKYRGAYPQVARCLKVVAAETNQQRPDEAGSPSLRVRDRMAMCRS
jgi:hypothetical protein